MCQGQALFIQCLHTRPHLNDLADLFSLLLHLSGNWKLFFGINEVGRIKSTSKFLLLFLRGWGYKCLLCGCLCTLAAMPWGGRPTAEVVPAGVGRAPRGTGTPRQQRTNSWRVAGVRHVPDKQDFLFYSVGFFPVSGKFNFRCCCPFTTLNANLIFHCLWCTCREKLMNVVSSLKSQTKIEESILSWKGPTSIIESNSLLHTRQPKS